jgi:hypothetical protein
MTRTASCVVVLSFPEVRATMDASMVALTSRIFRALLKLLIRSES